ncbi:SDR family oxidoreductase [Phaeacidiphilus oryzae]|uniref:SDR family oxidoreductase n=1 Tax=Phaeacidiphilus oryzae TaxID=348818 RepID=UPI000561AD48|nr:SDR family oxidoreductase [Phaeacidiphilus oryzae]
MQISGSTAVVTGAAGGIGAALAERLLAGGARVVLTDLNAERLDAVVERLSAEGRADRLLGLAGDAASEKHLRALIDSAESAFGPVDVFFANAGVGGGPGLDATDEQWRQALEVNVLGHVRAARLLVPGWLERGRGYFVATASAAGLLTQIGSAPYAVSKHGAVGFAEWLSVTYGNRGIRVSCLCPMGVNTEMLNSGAASDDKDRRTGNRAVTEAGAVLEPEEVAERVAEAVGGEEPFLILPHPEVGEFFRRKATDYERWLRGMRRYQDSLQ